jgi:hypothetical protein
MWMILESGNFQKITKNAHPYGQAVFAGLSGGI